MGDRKVTVFTARISSRDPDCYNITRKSGDPTFAPSWKLLNVYLSRIRTDTLSDNDWADYSKAYIEEMRTSYRRNRDAWEQLLAKERVVLVCYCMDPLRCHRRVLAEILVKLGATDGGEVD